MHDEEREIAERRATGGTGRTICVAGRVLDQEDGLGVYARYLLSELFALDRSSRYVLLLRSPRHRTTFAGHANVTTLVVTTVTKAAWDQITLARVARSVKADLIFNPKFSLPLLSRRPGVFVLHGSEWYVNPEYYEWWDIAYIRLLLPLYCRRAAHLTAISGTVVSDLVRFAGVDAAKVTISYAAPAPHFGRLPTPEEARAFRDRYRLPERYIFAVTRTVHTGHGGYFRYGGGNVETLVAAYRRYRAAGGELPLVVAGSRVREYLVDRGLGDGELEGIHLTGLIPHDEMSLGYALAELFVLTTLYESFSLPLVEAMASRCPVIAPLTGACPEVAGGAARLVNPRDPDEIAGAMLDLAASPASREELRRAGAKRVAAFTWRRVAERTLEAFERASLLANVPERRGVVAVERE